jgi:hypothetical protein
MTVVILSASCCYPGLAAYDDQTNKVIEQAINESGIPAEIKVLTGPSAVYSGVLPGPVMKNLINKFYRTRVGPAVVINGEVVFMGVPPLEKMKETLKNHMKGDKNGQQN